MRGTAQQRLGTAMKSNASAGFNSKPSTDQRTAVASVKPIEEVKEKSEEENFKEMEVDFWKVVLVSRLKNNLLKL